jgi:iron complex outermembrane receptor protein
MPKLQITADYYLIDITNRILNSAFLYGYSSGFGATGVVSQAVLNAIAARGVSLAASGVSYEGISIFANAANTQTQGLEATANYSSDFGEFGDVDWSLAFNYNQTTVTKLLPLPAGVVNTAYPQVNFLNTHALSALTTAIPQEKVILQALWSKDRWTVNLRSTVYGPSSEWTSFNGSGTGAGTFDEKIPVTPIFDLDVGFKITRQLKIDVGANNLFDTSPPKVPTVPNGSGGFRPVDGFSYNDVFNGVYTFAPWGIYGGYYYGRLTFSF